jgi:hypothetical protein
MTDDSKPLSRWQKIIAYVLAWIVALFATNPDGGLWSLVWMFPIGLVAFFYPAASQGGWGVLLIGAAVYVLHAVFYFRARSRLATIFLYVVLIGLLFCNVSGCRSMLKAH